MGGPTWDRIQTSNPNLVRLTTGPSDLHKQGDSCPRVGWRSPGKEERRRFLLSNYLGVCCYLEAQLHWMTGTIGILVGRAAKDWVLLIT